MKKIALAAAVGLGAAILAAPAAQAAPPTCNWGQLTSQSIASGFPQGEHASDPSGDGKGREDRVGLANVVNKGDLHATCEALS
jgi:hypothetical protein